jgi:UDP-N-acetylglucosamine 2-epimerase (non-hydrolysing)
VRWLRTRRVDFVLVWSGQHYDYELSQVFFEQLSLPEPDANLGIKSGSNCGQTAKVMVKLKKAFVQFKPSLVVAEGDTNTVCATALAAMKSEIPFAHVESGLRSFDRTMPEEINRIVSDSCSELLFAPTSIAVMNLVHEGVPLRKIRLTGNTVVDVVKENKKVANRAAAPLMRELDVRPLEYLLVTFHRRENIDDPSRLLDLANVLHLLGKKFKIVFPVHPHTRLKLQMSGMLKNLQDIDGIDLIPPIGYFEFLGLLSNSVAVLTDSGGVQEEALTLRIPTVTLRHNTERPETVALGANVLAGTNPEHVYKMTEMQIRKHLKIKSDLSAKPNPIGDGKAGERISREIERVIETGIEIEASDTKEDPYILYALVDSKLLSRKMNRNTEILASYDHNGVSNEASAVPDFDKNLGTRSLEGKRVLVRIPHKILTKFYNRGTSRSGEAS